YTTEGQTADIARDAEHDLATSDRYAETARLTKTVAIKHDVAVDPVCVSAADHRRGGVVDSGCHDPELDGEIRRADIRRRSRKACRRIIDADLHPIDIAAASAKEMQ